MKITRIRSKKYFVFAITFISIALPLGTCFLVLYILDFGIWARSIWLVMHALSLSFLYDIIRGSGISFVFDDIARTVKITGVPNKMLPQEAVSEEETDQDLHIRYDKIANYILQGKTLIINPREDDTRELNLSSFTDKQILQIKAELDRIITRNAMKS